MLNAELYIQVFRRQIFSKRLKCEGDWFWQRAMVIYYGDAMFCFYCKHENMLKSEYVSFFSRFPKDFQREFCETPMNSCKNYENLKRQNWPLLSKIMLCTTILLWFKTCLWWDNLTLNLTVLIDWYCNMKELYTYIHLLLQWKERIQLLPLGIFWQVC